MKSKIHRFSLLFPLLFLICSSEMTIFVEASGIAPCYERNTPKNRNAFEDKKNWVGKLFSGIFPSFQNFEIFWTWQEDGNTHLVIRENGKDSTLRKNYFVFINSLLEEHKLKFTGDFFFPQSFFSEKEFRAYFNDNLGFAMMGMPPFLQTLPTGEQIFLVWDPSTLGSGAKIYGSSNGKIELLFFVSTLFEDFSFSLNQDAYAMSCNDEKGAKKEIAALRLQDGKWILQITSEGGSWRQDRASFCYKNKRGSTINLVNAYADSFSEAFKNLRRQNIGVTTPDEMLPILLESVEPFFESSLHHLHYLPLVL